VRRWTLSAPPTNALTETLLNSLSAAASDAGASQAVRCVLLDAEGGRYFSSGLSLDDLFGRPEGERVGLFHALLKAHRAIAELGKPTLAAIGGRAILGGWILAMACDVRLLDAKNGRVALNEVRYGLTPSEILIRRMLSISGNPAAVRALVLRGRTFKAEEALAAGFVDRLVAPEDLESEAAAEARTLARGAPEAYAKVKEALRSASGAYAEQTWSRELSAFEQILKTEEAAEGLAAMREKRKPRWE
jgi:enoyl-CoA hydratase